MTALAIERADFAEAALVAFLQAHLDDLAPTAPPSSQHALDVAGLQRPGVRLWVARDAGAFVGTVALAPVAAGDIGAARGADDAGAPGGANDAGARHEELKSMRTDPARRGRGIASAMLRHALADARARGVGRVSLETGSQPFFAPARALYAKHGFAGCAPFGAYRPDPNSAFMTLVLTPSATAAARATAAQPAR